MIAFASCYLEKYDKIKVKISQKTEDEQWKTKVFQTLLKNT